MVVQLAQKKGKAAGRTTTPTRITVVPHNTIPTANTTFSHRFIHFHCHCKFVRLNMGGGKDKAPLTPVERLQELSLIKKVSEEMAPHLQGLQDKTLSEFVIHLAEKTVKKIWKKNKTALHGSVLQLEAAQSIREELTSNGAANLPLSLCSQLVQLVIEQSPRIARLQKKAQEKSEQQEKLAPAVMSATEASQRKMELGASFPGLAKQNLSKAVPLDEGFYDHGKESSKRAVSNLPAWMTKKEKADEDNDSKPPSKKARREEGLQIYGIYKGRVSKILDFGMVVEISIGDKEESGMVHNSHLSKTRVNHASEAGKSHNIYKTQ
jgi:hypothetical protein